ncbi:MAG: ISAs1 family transposase [Pirellulaceae bacterium]|jgi:predicted transposase YbfD/YdcC|nr:ISAs1 family transposase [Pirellulaceae bacterium]MBX3417775.1 ISAs1 family transposase [Pirellulaceae bacterium]MBX3418016.1 ISAs1 family transposase [Pirellulaceae bacterium]MBX3418151.1 ISAs1 family transposase [Pirellulaceae bacterium]MBX3418571.1 ISAs1 family transposase [Pirellulaceae bacterium]
MPKLEIARHFESITDPRIETSNRRHLLIDILVLGVCAMLSGAEGWKDMHNYGVARKHLFKKFLKLKSGVPSDDTFRRVFSAIKPEQLTACFLSWVRAIAPETEHSIINIDGKTARRSHDHKNGVKALHMVTAWAAENQMVLGQEAVDEKSNEITAIPKLLSLLELEGAIVTIDAMGCQREIASQIVSEGGDYILGLKGNQGTLEADVSDLAEEILGTMEGVQCLEKTETGHGRVEHRTWYQFPVSKELQQKHQWPGLKTIGVAVNNVTRDGKESYEVRYYLLSFSMDIDKFAKGCRAHWSIENSLHWRLDVIFNEDQCRINGTGAINSSSMRRMALTLLKNYKGDKESVRTRRLRCAWDEHYLFKVLGISMEK